MSESDRYTRRAILRSEEMYGRGFQSPGQVEALEVACGRLELRPGMRVLDVGSGLGGPAMYLAAEHGLVVTGVDLAHDMVELSRERLVESGLVGVAFVEGDVRDLPLERGSFDLVWTRDAILYVSDKASIWRRLRELLRAGGQLYSADFCRGDAELAPDFEQYLATAGYHLQSMAGYAATLSASGFGDVEAVDQTGLFERSLERELDRLEARADSFLAAYDREDYDYLVGRWRKKIDFCRRGQLSWGWFLARA